MTSSENESGEEFERDEPPREGATPLHPDEAEGLIPAHITTRAELNAWEQANILEAEDWLRKRRLASPVLDMGFVRQLHRRMFSDTWEWAGKFRKTLKNISVAPELVSERTKTLLDDVQYWLDNGTYSIDEIAARFHHSLVAIHPFPNGNGRHGRLMTDALLRQAGALPFSWGSASLDAEGKARKRYIRALQAADAGDYAQLFSFVRT